MTPVEIFLFYFLALLAELLGTLGGFGSSLFFVPLAGLFFDPTSVLGITALFHVMSNGAKLWLFKKEYHNNIWLTIGIPSILGVIPGAILASFWNSDYLVLGQGFLLMGLAVLLFFTKDVGFGKSKLWLISSGLLAGFFAGWLGTGGAIRGLALSTLALPSSLFLFTSAAIDMGVDVSRSFIYGIQGFIHTHDLWLLPGLFVVSWTGSWMGKIILEKISLRPFRKMVLGMVFITGLYLVWSFLH